MVVTNKELRVMGIPEKEVKRILDGASRYGICKVISTYIEKKDKHPP